MKQLLSEYYMYLQLSLNHVYRNLPFIKAKDEKVSDFNYGTMALEILY